MHEPFIKHMAALLRQCEPRHDLYSVFGDCMEAMALAISNSVDRRQFEAREARYLDIVGRYDRQTVDIFPALMAELTLALEQGPGDVLGALFHHLEFHNKARGQFFTPYIISRMMADVSLAGSMAQDAIARRGFLTACEPACGAGAMVIALADAMRAEGINYRQKLHVTAVDIDPRAIHMAYSQFTLLHIPAHLMVGNSLSGEVSAHWFTPAHVLGGWSARLAAAASREARTAASDEQTSVATRLPVASQAGPPAAAQLPLQLKLF